jgi:hypothetical protein
VEPSVILVEDIERVFVKKSSGSERMDRKRLRKEIPKLVRNVFIDDRIMMIGTSSAPWECDQKVDATRGFSMKFFQHFSIILEFGSMFPAHDRHTTT